MRESAIILPLLDNNGVSLAGVHNELRGVLVDAFGGFTAQTVEGQWKDQTTGLVYTDQSVEYRIAGDWVGKAPGKLDRIAATFARKAGQECVYVRHADGEVAFVSPRTEAAPRWVDYEEEEGARRRA